MYYSSVSSCYIIAQISKIIFIFTPKRNIMHFYKSNTLCWPKVLSPIYYMHASVNIVSLVPSSFNIPKTEHLKIFRNLVYPLASRYGSHCG